MNDQMFNVKFVQEVEKYPCLYNYQLSEYSRKDVTDSAWNNIGKEMNLTGSACKERWKNLRAVFVRQIKPGPSGSGAKRKKYYLTDIMQFILPFIKIAVPSESGNFPENDTSHELQEKKPDIEPAEVLEEQNNTSRSQIFQQNLETQSSAQEVHENDKLTPLQKTARRKKPLDEVDKEQEVDKSFINYLKVREMQRADINTRKSFLMSLLDETEDMSNDQWRLFKRRIFSLIDEIKNPSNILMP